jgi:hypothetical protein
VRALDVVLEYWTTREMDTGAADDRREIFCNICTHMFILVVYKTDSYIVQE